MRGIPVCSPDARRHVQRRTSVLAIPVWRRDDYLRAQPLWLVVARRGQGQEPWYLLTTEPVTTTEDAWRIVYAYARRWQIELCGRYGTSELALESPRVWSWEGRQKFLLLAILAYAFLLSLLHDDHTLIRQWVLRYWRLWLAHLPLPLLQNSG